MTRTGNTTRKAAPRDRRPQDRAPQPGSPVPSVAIVGGGLAGLTLALLLARGGVPVSCVDRESVDARGDGASDGRTMAITWGSRRILERAGLWAALAPCACPIRDIQVFDGGGPMRLRFESAQADGETFGWVIEIAHLRAVLCRAAAQCPGLDHRASTAVTGLGLEGDLRVLTLGDGGTLAARLVVGADGRGSLIREAGGIRTRGWPYGQRAVVCTLTHENPHEGRAVEHFYPGGPFALLPMTDGPDGTHRSTMVWVEDADEKASVRDWSAEIFHVALAARIPAEYGRARLAGPRFSYPLSHRHARRYVAQRLALVGDAAHGIHPVAGQGLNLGLRDVADLAQRLIAASEKGEDPGADALLRAYERARRFDSVTMAGAMDALNRLFASDRPAVKAARALGLRVAGGAPPIRRLLMNRLMGRQAR